MYRPTRLALIALVATSFATVGLACSDATAPVASWLYGTYGRDYYSSTATVDRHKLTFKAHLLGGTVVDLDGSLTGPFITGRVTFFTYLGCCSQTYYSGRFVMKREP